MIVFPKTYNYRLIIVWLIVALSILSVYSIYSFSTLQDYKSYLVQEKKLIQNELSEMISRFDTLEVKNIELRQKLNASRQKVQKTLDSLNTLSISTEILSYYKSRLQILKEERKTFLDLVEQLEQENRRLTLEAEKTEEELDQANSEVKNLKQNNRYLSSNQNALSKKVEKASQLQATMLEASAVKRVTKSKVITTERASRANKFVVQFIVPKNMLVEEGEKEFYIQILNPDNNVVSDQGNTVFDNKSLIYTKKIKVNYQKEDLNVSTFIETTKEEPIKNGVYFVNVFNNQNRVATTSITLK
ncbi:MULTISPECIES: hypothetical protein [Mesoflavibacter]|uniref:hypothetical protein n=1 Tax=Mesoflavibacter TaxID=444051 RepID=UPI000D10BCF2|nr:MULTISPECIES: hypothetical protein [Mesoflavibacter]QIJ88678.1 hypothetical protein C7H62_0869 [Mesoflavibacter sp. HG96]QIJ91406.1 hypothetical protein C7H56_0869 [Mesoflavibacter sp. HG37]